MVRALPSHGRGHWSESSIAHHLQVTMRAFDMNTFNTIIVTAANAAQANGYRAQLRGRKGFRVISDPGGKRVGSLGATVNVLRILRRVGECHGRVLICHSGGDAKRTPAYAALGKAFVPMPDGRPMLDHIIEAMSALPSEPGIVVCCGDVIPRLNASGVKFARRGVTGVAYPDGPWQAQRHGVYVIKEEGRRKREEGTAPIPVAGFLQKPKVSRGKFLIDTGIMHIGWDTAEKIEHLPIAGDIYEEFPKMLLGGFAPFSVSVVPECEFFHIGSSRELLTKLGSRVHGAQTFVDACAAHIAHLGGDNIVTNVPAEYGTVSLGRGECLTAMPLDDGKWQYLKYRIDDNFKSDGLWERHNLGEKMKHIDHARLLALRAPRSVKVTVPARIDFAGGWSDTPPICFKEGGTVFSAAVTVDGERPIEVTVSPRSDKLIKVVSRDLGKRCILQSATEIADHHDPSDWCCLVKSALTVTGFKFGSRGINIEISSGLPKGSGMGTSSILGAATIAALLGKIDIAKIGALTLELEREMRTGGGWQDQFAGMAPGFKLMRSKPGERQKIEIRQINPPAAFMREFSKRSLLYFTGQKRMARNVLRRVIGFYADNPHNFGKILIDSLKRGAESAAKAAASGDIEAFARCVRDYWRDKKLLDAGSTNEKVDDMMDAIRPYVSAATLAGAGGGGFMYILAKSPSDARRVRKMLENHPSAPGSRFYTLNIDNEGMRITET